MTLYFFFKIKFYKQFNINVTKIIKLIKVLDEDNNKDKKAKKL